MEKRAEVRTEVRRSRRATIRLLVVALLAAGVPALADVREDPPEGAATSIDSPLSPPADVRPPLPLPGESGTLERPSGGPCAHDSEAACIAASACAWVKVYGTVPGHPPLAFCYVRGERLEPAAAPPDLPLPAQLLPPK